MLKHCVYLLADKNRIFTARNNFTTANISNCTEAEKHFTIGKMHEFEAEVNVKVRDSVAINFSSSRLFFSFFTGIISGLSQSLERSSVIGIMLTRARFCGEETRLGIFLRIREYSDYVYSFCSIFFLVSLG